MDVSQNSNHSQTCQDPDVTEFYCIAEFDLEGMKEIEELINGSDNFELAVSSSVLLYHISFPLNTNRDLTLTVHY